MVLVDIGDGRLHGVRQLTVGIADRDALHLAPELLVSAEAPGMAVLVCGRQLSPRLLQVPRHQPVVVDDILRQLTGRCCSRSSAGQRAAGCLASCGRRLRRLRP